MSWTRAEREETRPRILSSMRPPLRQQSFRMLWSLTSRYRESQGTLPQKQNYSTVKSTVTPLCASKGTWVNLNVTVRNMALQAFPGTTPPSLPLTLLLQADLILKLFFFCFLLVTGKAQETGKKSYNTQSTTKCTNTYSKRNSKILLASSNPFG